MWICRKCETENESNFNFCWSCGRPATSSEAVSETIEPAIGHVPEEIPDAPVILKKRIAAEPEPPAELPPVRQIPESEPLAKPTGDIFKPELAPAKTPAPMPQVIRQADDVPTVRPSVSEDAIAIEVSTSKATGSGNPQSARVGEIHQPELFSTLISGDLNESDFADVEIDKQRQVFAIAVRLFGLALLFLFVTGIPDFASSVLTVVLDSQDSGFWKSVAVPLAFPLTRLLFYLIAGVYLISSGRILIRLLPR